MQSFKQFLKEDEDNFDFWPKEDIEDWVTGNGLRIVKKYNLDVRGNTGSIVRPEVSDNGVVSASNISMSSFEGYFPRIGNSNLRHFPCQFGQIEKHFFVTHCDLGSLKGAPYSVGGKFSVGNNKNISSIEYLPQEASTYILRNTSIKSFSGIHKVIKRFLNNTNADSGKVVIPQSVESCLLGFLQIPGFTHLSCMDILSPSDNKNSLKLQSAVDIINNHAEDKDILQCQEDLIDAGLKEYAKL